MIDDLPGVFSRIRSALRRRVRSVQDVEDLLHDAYLRLERFVRENVVENPEALLMTIAINLSKDAHRAQARRGVETLVEHEVILDTAPGLEEVMLSRERFDRLDACLKRLPEKTRNIILAHRLDGLTYKEIARLQGLSVSSVEKHIAKAMMMLTSDMEGWYP